MFVNTVGIPMDTSCGLLLADLFLHLYEAGFKQGLLKKNEKKLALYFNLILHYIDNVRSLINCKFGDFV